MRGLLVKTSDWEHIGRPREVYPGYEMRSITARLQLPLSCLGSGNRSSPKYRHRRLYMRHDRVTDGVLDDLGNGVYIVAHNKPFI